MSAHEKEWETMMQKKMGGTFSKTLLALAAVSAVDSASAFEQIVVEWRDQMY
jgi:hypothetical protein